MSIDSLHEAPDPERSGPPEHSQPEPTLAGPGDTADQIVKMGEPAPGTEIFSSEEPGDRPDNLEDQDLAFASVQIEEIVNQVAEGLAELPGEVPDRQAGMAEVAADPEQVFADVTDFLGTIDKTAEHQAITAFSKDDVAIVVRALTVAVRELGRETVINITKALAADRKYFDMLLYISETSGVEGPGRLPVSRRLGLAAGALLAFGIGVPLLAPPTGEVIYANGTAAIGVLLAAVAAYFRR